MYCSGCGKELCSEDKFCQFCGKANENYLNKEAHTINPTVVDNKYHSKAYKAPSAVFGILALIFGLLGGWLGLVFAIIGLKVYDKDLDSGKRLMCYIGLFAFVVWIIILIALNL